MYESPIKVFQENLEIQFEGEILKAVQRVDITVDRDELIRALRCDREQYQKGFDDARKDAVPVAHGRWEQDADGDWYCTNCDEAVAICDSGKERTYRKPYCPNCGAKMDGDDTK